jgi:mannose-6-phosphate isomerase-like protein (cupin superfamily)
MANSISIQNIYEKIKSAPLDPAVGIRVVPLVGDDAFTLFAAEIGPRKRVGAHFHAEGLEIYQIVEGRGEMHLGKTLGDGQTEWRAVANVQKGDCFTVQAGEVHQLINDHDERLVALFGCPKSHLSTDRTMVQGLAAP